MILVVYRKPDCCVCVCACMCVKPHLLLNHVVFLDLPVPWEAIDSAKTALKVKHMMVPSI